MAVDGYLGLHDGVVGLCVFLGFRGALDPELLHGRCLGRQS